MEIRFFGGTDGGWTAGMLRPNGGDGPSGVGQLTKSFTFLALRMVDTDRSRLARVTRATGLSGAMLVLPYYGAGAFGMQGSAPNQEEATPPG